LVAATPKFKSSEFKKVLAEVKEIFDAHSLGIILLDALERRVAEKIYAASTRQSRGARVDNRKKTELVGQLTAGFFAVDDIAYQLIKELDRACQKERHIVASIPEAQAPDRIGSYRAIALKRERAKLVWALARDERAAVRQLANRVIKEFFQEAAEFETARAVLEGDEDESALDGIELAKRLQEQAERLAEAAQRVTDLESQVTSFEAERAKLLAQMGSKERVLRQETEARTELEAQLADLKRALADVEIAHREAQQAKASEEEARAKAEELEQRVRRLTKLAGASKTLTSKELELDEVRRRSEELQAQLARQDQATAIALAEREQRIEKLRVEVESLREELHVARKRIVDLERRVPEEDHTKERAENSVAILLDQANLAATAAAVFRRKVNFAALYDRLRAGRQVVRALAFVVDNGGTAFEAFCDTLRKSGWELRVKKPKVFADGQTKADWDMGIAMEAVALRGQADTMILVSGDGDFAPLLKQLQRWGHRVEVAAFPDGLALELVNAADSIVRLDAGTLE
jgi:uncharacterized LabA/DUF88 family protein